MSISNRGRMIAAALILPVLMIGGSPVFAQDAPALPANYGNLLVPIFTGNQTTIGEPIAYPAEGVPNVTNAIVTVPPGGETGWHLHTVPLYFYILDGTVTVDYGSKGTRTIAAGSGFLEAMNWPHNAHNYGDVPVQILAVYLGVEGVANADTAAGPQ